jgi:single-strand DNA-binding protein
MAGNYNRIVLVGNLTRDPEIRYIDGGAKGVTKFALAINRKMKSGDETMFIDVVAWDRLGEICNQYLKKGMSTLVEGRLSIRDYTNKDGEKRKAIEVVASDMQILDAKSRNEGGQPATQGARAAVGAVKPASNDDFGDGFDEVPF